MSRENSFLIKQNEYSQKLKRQLKKVVCDIPFWKLHIFLFAFLAYMTIYDFQLWDCRLSGFTDLLKLIVTIDMYITLINRPKKDDHICPIFYKQAESKDSQI